MFRRLFGVNNLVKDESKVEDQERIFSLLFNKESYSVDRIMLCGPFSSGKTSLLFELALSFADENKYVLFISPKKIAKLPLLCRGRSQPTSGSLKYIQMAYLETRTEFLNHMASIHFATTRRYNCIIVDDLDAYFASSTKNEDLAIVARVFALTVDAFQFQLSKLKQGTTDVNGMLVVSLTVPSGAVSIPRQQLYERWIQCFLHTKEKQANLFEMSLFPSNNRSPTSLATITYKITDQTITVQDIEYSSQTESTGSE